MISRYRLIIDDREDWNESNLFIREVIKVAMTTNVKGKKICPDCGKLFEYRSPKKQRCDFCAKERRRKQARIAYSPDGSKIGYNQRGMNNNH